jgi:hypothetical protein
VNQKQIYYNCKTFLNIMQVYWEWIIIHVPAILGIKCFQLAPQSVMSPIIISKPHNSMLILYLLVKQIYIYIHTHTYIPPGYLLFFLYSFIHMGIHCLGYFSQSSLNSNTFLSLNYSMKTIQFWGKNELFIT